MIKVEYSLPWMTSWFPVQCRGI